MPSPAAPNSGFGGWQASTRIRQPGCGQIDVWLLLSADYLSRQDSLLNCLNGQERCRAQKKKIPSKKFEYILAQAALRCVLAQVLGIKHDEVSYQRGHKGKPALSALHERPDLHFNISHSSGMMLIAISAAGEVGVDLEGINTSTSIDLVSRRAFSQRECVDLQNQMEDVRRPYFFQLWTCKEAVVKCSGDGIHSGMSKFSIIFPFAGSAKITAAQGLQSKVMTYSISPLPLGIHHKGALVCAGEFKKLNLHYLADLPI